RTVIRACNRLEELGIVKQFDLKSDGGDRRQSSNAIVIQPFKKSEKVESFPTKKSEVTPEMSRHKAQEPIKLLKPNKHNTNTYVEEHSSTSKQPESTEQERLQTPYQQFASTVRQFGG